MLHTPSNRSTPVSGDTITKLVRQHYKPPPPVPYRDEAIKCRTETTCQLGKPEDYWVTNFNRRQQNFDKGFFTAPTEPYRPIGGDLILDSGELVMSCLPGNFDKRLQARMSRRGTIYEVASPIPMFRSDAKSEQCSSTNSQDLVDTCPSAGFDNIKKLVRESRDRVVCVRAGHAYEDHVRAVEEQALIEQTSKLPEDTEMALCSLSSLYLPMTTVDSSSSRGSSPLSTRIASSSNKARKLAYSEKERKAMGICEALMAPPALETPTDIPGLKVPTGPRPRSVLKSDANKVSLVQCTSGFTAALLRKERQFRDHLSFLKWTYNILTAIHNMKVKDIRSKVPLPKDLVKKLQMDGPRDQDERSSRATHISRLYKPAKMSVTDTADDTQSVTGRMSVFGTIKRINAFDAIGKSFARDNRRRSRNAFGLAGSDRPVVETWEDLLNVQPQEYKEDGRDVFGLQVGVITKFMKWRASIVPTFGGAMPSTDNSGVTQSSPENKDASSTPAQPVTKEKKLPIWQQVAQEKSTVFHNNKTDVPNPDTVVMRFRRDLNKLKKNIQKENTAELEKLVRERVATFRLKFGALDQEECRPFFEDQIVRIQQAREYVNKEQLENFDVQPSKWYEELREKSLALVSTFDQPQIREMISKLHTYAHMDNKTVPYAKAKLCLFMMSIPGYEICQISVQRSLKFIFQRILLGQEDQFEEWLEHRKIPYMVFSASRPRSASFKD